MKIEEVWIEDLTKELFNCCAEVAMFAIVVTKGSKTKKRNYIVKRLNIAMAAIIDIVTEIKRRIEKEG